jgi:Ser/Thr protein kinase RdoA (MazF antagonist)
VKDELERLRSSLPAWVELREISPLAAGNRNTLMLVERRGERFVAKTTRRSHEAIEWVVQVLQQATAAGLEVPRLVPSLGGRLVEQGVTLETWVEGPRLPRLDLPRVLPLIREFHRLTRGFPQRPGFASSRDLLLAESGGDVDFARMPKHLVAACRSAWEQIATAEHCVVHGDLNPANLLLTPSGAIGLVDWDEARLDAPLLDEASILVTDAGERRSEWTAAKRALLAWEVAVSWQLEPEYARRLAAELA